MSDESDNDSGGGEEDFSGLATTTPQVTLTAPDDDGGDDEEDAQPAKGAERGKNGRWKERKTDRDRGRGKLRGELESLKQSNTTLQQKLDALTSAHSEERRQLFSMLQQRAPTQQEANQGEQDSDVKRLKQALLTERELLARDPKRPTDAYDDLQDQLIDARAKAVVKAMLAEMQGNREAPDSSSEARKAVWQTTMESEFPWIANNATAMKAAGNYRRYLLESGKPDTIETVRLAIAHVGKEMGLGARAQPTQRQRNGFVAPPAGNMSGGDGRRSVTVPDARMLAGTGLSKERLSKALFKGE